MEIGIQHKASLALWKILYKNAEVIGWDIDISQPCHPKAQEMINESVLKLVEGDAYTALSKMPTGLSMIIDDGPHTLTTQLAVLALRHNLEASGVLVIEDVGQIGGPRHCFFNLIKSLTTRERKYTLNIDLTDIKGRWDDAVFIYTRNDEVLKRLREIHQGRIQSFKSLLMYSLVWRLKTILRKLIYHKFV